MKKILATALILSLSTAVLTSPVLADSQEKEQAPKNVFVKNLHQTESKRLEGVLKEVKDHIWIVVGEDGKEYTVPTLGFEQLDDFKNLNPTVGTKVTLEGNNFNPADGPIKIAHRIETVKADGDKALTENIRVFKYDSEQGSVEIDRDEIEKMMKDTGVGVVKAVRGTPLEGKQNIMIKKGEGDFESVKILKLGNKEGNVTLNNEDVQQTVIVKEPVEIRTEKGITVEGKMMLKGKEFMEALKGEVFMAHEITMNGTTLKLPMMRVAMPAVSTVDIEKE